MRKYCKSPFANMVEQWASSPALKAFAAPIECSHCGVLCKSYQAYAVHLPRKHNVKSKFRMYVMGNTCKVCLVNFHTRERCLNHVRYRSKVCKHNYLLRGPVLDEAEASLLDAADYAENRILYAKGLRRHQALCPSMRAFGPLLPLLNERPSKHHPLGFGHNYR